MPKNHARKNALAAIKADHGVPHHEAIAILDDPRSESILELMDTYEDVNSRAEAVAVLEDPRNEVMCEKCGWTNGMVCPECPGCGCYNGQCSGWRHHEYMDQDEREAAAYHECDCGFAGHEDHCCECGMVGNEMVYHCVCG